MRRRYVRMLEEVGVLLAALIGAIFTVLWIVEDFGFALAAALILIGPLLIAVPLIAVLYEQFDPSGRKSRGGFR